MCKFKIMNKSRFFVFLLVAIIVSSLMACQKKDERMFEPIIQNGIQKNTIPMGKKWKQGGRYMYCSGKGDNFDNMMYSSFYVFDDDFHIKMNISFDTIGETTSIFWFFNNHFGFDSDNKGNDMHERLFIYTPKYDSLLYFQHSKEVFTPGVPFIFEIIREGDSVSFKIDEKLITKQSKELFAEPMKGTIGIRPWKNRIQIYDWEINGNIAPLPDVDFVFKSGEAGYACFRIPSIIQANDGSLLAFAEARQNTCRDNYDVDIVMKKSTDNGETWGSVQLIWADSTNTCSYPVPIVDRESGRVVLFSVWSRGDDHWRDIFKRQGKDTRHIFLFTSEDNGNNWSEKREITNQIKLPEWDYYGIGTGSGIQMKSPKFKNRMVAACYFSTLVDGKTTFRSHLIYSDDGGLNWDIGGITPETATSECEVAELDDGVLMINMTKRSRTIRARSVAYSYDGGLTIENQFLDKELWGPFCQASLDSYVDENGKHVALFANPRHLYGREDMTIQRSFNGGESWEVFQLVFNGYSGNSDLLVMENGQVGIFFECGKIWSRDGLAFRKFDLK